MEKMLLQVLFIPIMKRRKTQNNQIMEQNLLGLERILLKYTYLVSHDI